MRRTGLRAGRFRARRERRLERAAIRRANMRCTRWLARRDQLRGLGIMFAAWSRAIEGFAAAFENIGPAISATVARWTDEMREIAARRETEMAS